MPLVDITLQKGLSPRTKENIRHDIGCHLAELIGIAPSFVAVLFKELPEGDMSHHGSFTEIYLSAGRDAAFKDEVARFVAEDICRHTGWDPSCANLMFNDIRSGSVAVSGRVVNRNGTAADAVKSGLIK